MKKSKCKIVDVLLCVVFITAKLLGSYAIILQVLACCSIVPERPPLIYFIGLISVLLCLILKKATYHLKSIK